MNTKPTDDSADTTAGHNAPLPPGGAGTGTVLDGMLEIYGRLTAARHATETSSAPETAIGSNNGGESIAESGT